MVFSLFQPANAATFLRHSSWPSLQRGSLGMANWQRLAACSGIRFSVKKMSFQNHQSGSGLADMLCLKTYPWVTMLFDLTWFSVTQLIKKNIVSLAYSTLYGSVTIIHLICFVGLAKQNCKDPDPTFFNQTKTTSLEWVDTVPHFQISPPVAPWSTEGWH